MLIIDMNLHRPRLACLSLFLTFELFWRNNKTIIEFGFHRIWRILQISEGVIHRTASVDNNEILPHFVHEILSFIQ